MFRSPLVVLGLLSLIDCSSGTPCSNTNCGGCCTSAGLCDVGNTSNACGTGGVACRICGVTEQCSAAVCVARSPRPTYTPCASTNECTRETCFPGGPSSGQCSRSCVADEDCSGDVCRSYGSQSYCHQTCSGDAGCRSDLSCQNGVCRGNGGQTPACSDYTDCYYKSGGTPGVLDTTYGPLGTCWQTQAVALSCDEACRQTNIAFIQNGYTAAYDCTFPSCTSDACDAGTRPVQSSECRNFADCYYRSGGTPGALDTSYGPFGSCWQSTQGTANACTDACRSANDSYWSSGIAADAGCKR